MQDTTNVEGMSDVQALSILDAIWDMDFCQGEDEAQAARDEEYYDPSNWE